MLTGALATAPDAARTARNGFADVELDRLFQGLAAAESLVIAVSGGPDSLALMILAARWAARLGTTAPRLHVATVDHGLRPDSRGEADFVASCAAKAGLAHATLVWTGPKPATRVQERARAARYALLAAHARAVGAPFVLTAHHADDQAETVLMRLARGSGVRGLAGMRRQTRLAPDVALVRPLLDCRKAELVEVCRNESLRWQDDPANENPRFARARLRAEAAVLARIGLDGPGLGRLARRMARADAALEAEVDRLESRLDQGVRMELRTGELGVPFAAVAKAPTEIALRIVERLVGRVAAENHAIRLERLEALVEALLLAAREGRAHRATLGGTRIVLRAAGELILTPEAARRRGRKNLAPAVIKAESTR